MCGRCDQKCPVGIELTPIRMIQRRSRETEIDIQEYLERLFQEPAKYFSSKRPGDPVI